jgi:ribonuclease Z
MQPVVVTLTGTGTPRPAKGRAGAGVLVEHGNTALQFDAGRATVLRLREAGRACRELDAIFVTHHHADHVMALPDLLLTRWIEGAREPVDVVAPAGPLDDFGRDVLKLFDHDIAARRAHTGRPPLPLPVWHAFEASTEPSVVWKTEGCEVSSVSVRHEPVEPAVAYRVDLAGRKIVISGDTRVCAEVEMLARDADLLVHEVVRVADLEGGRDYIADYHADSVALGGLAERAGVRRLVLTHLEPAPESQEQERAFVRDIRDGGFGGEVHVGRDLMQVRL